MATPIEMPKLGNTVEECLLARGTSAKGDAVADGRARRRDRDRQGDLRTDRSRRRHAAGDVLRTKATWSRCSPISASSARPARASTPFQPPSGRARRRRAVGSSAQQSRRRAEPRPSAAVPAPPAGRRPSTAPARGASPRDHDFPAGTVAGSGPGGRVLEEDLRRLYLESPRPSSLARQA